jgi:hypothetical protein
MQVWKKSLGIAAAAVLLVSGPVASAQSSAASKLSVTNSAARSPTATKKASELRGGFIIPLVAVVAIILGILAATGGSERPHSP